jgi:hypothetical protein
MFRSCPNEKVVSSYFLLAVLNSKVFWTWAKHRMPTLGSGWYSYRVSVLRKFPIPVPLHGQSNPLLEDIANLAARLLKSLTEQVVLTLYIRLITRFVNSTESHKVNCLNTVKGNPHDDFRGSNTGVFERKIPINCEKMR